MAKAEVSTPLKWAAMLDGSFRLENMFCDDQMMPHSMPFDAPQLLSAVFVQHFYQTHLC